MTSRKQQPPAKAGPHSTTMAQKMESFASLNLIVDDYDLKPCGNWTHLKSPERSKNGPRFDWDAAHCANLIQTVENFSSTHALIAYLRTGRRITPELAETIAKLLEGSLKADKSPVPLDKWDKQFWSGHHALWKESFRDAAAKTEERRILSEMLRSTKYEGWLKKEKQLAWRFPANDGEISAAATHVVGSLFGFNYAKTRKLIYGIYPGQQGKN